MTQSDAECTEQNQTLKFGGDNIITEYVDAGRVAASYYFTYKGKPSKEIITPEGMTVYKFKDGVFMESGYGNFSLRGKDYKLFGSNPDYTYYMFNTTAIPVGTGFSWFKDGEIIKAVLVCNVKLKIPESNDIKQINELIQNMFQTKHKEEKFEGTMGIKYVTAQHISDRLSAVIQYYVATMPTITNAPLDHLQEIADSFFMTLSQSGQIKDSSFKVTSSVMLAFQFTDRDKRLIEQHKTIHEGQMTQLSNNRVLFQLKASKKVQDEVAALQNGN